jgi:acetyltransferase-like isoleucine patch superfamily enzyme
MLSNLKETLKKSPALKKLALTLLYPKNQYRPRWFISAFVNPFKHKRGRGSVVCRYVRLDVMPFNNFVLGRDSVIEDFACINNGVGPVFIGERSLIGLSDVIIGPVTIGNDVLLAQHVVVSALNHNYEDITQPIKNQGVTTKPIVIEDGVWIGANAVIAPGVRIGKNSVVGAGSVVTHDVPPFSVAVGAPAKILKTYQPNTQIWERMDKKIMS